MLALRNALDDPSQETCGKCENCIAGASAYKVFDQRNWNKSNSVLRHSEEIIKPRKQIAASNDEAARTFVEYEFPRNLGDSRSRGPCFIPLGRCRLGADGCRQQTCRAFQ